MNFDKRAVLNDFSLTSSEYTFRAEGESEARLFANSETCSD